MGASYMEAMDSLEKRHHAEHEELLYLRWFKQNADFGPADSDVHMLMNQAYERDTGKRVPDGWRHDE